MVGDRIRYLRKEKHLTMKQLGQLLGVSESAVCLYETNKREPNYATIIELSKIFNVTIDYLYGDEFSLAEKENCCYLPPDIYARLETMAVKQNSSVESVLQTIIRNYLEENPF